MSSDTEEIKKIVARQILDSRGNPTVEVDIITKNGFFGRAAVPSGASTGIYEAVELRDGDKNYYHGKGVKKAISNIHKIASKLKGFNVFNQKELDYYLIELDGTENKSNLGANAILGISLAVAKAGAAASKKPLFRYLSGEQEDYLLPIPFMNIINGGKHAGNDLAIQEFMIVPVGAKSFSNAIRMGSEVYHTLKEQLVKRYGPTARNVGDEGGFSPPLNKTEDALSEIIEAIELTGYNPHKEICLAIDAAASVFYKDGFYYIDNNEYDTEQMIDFYKELSSKFMVKSIEDPFDENAFESFASLTKEVKNNAQIVGDDLFVSNVKRLSKGISMGACNCLLLKVNQIGTLTEAIEAAEMAFSNGYSVMVSHRSGETEDTTISDLSVALSTGQLKSGAPARTERTSKYNQLIRIEEELGSHAKYPTGKLGFISCS
ncbi:MAG: phosphopyruvate hydratase [Candidatus Odinarchaeia archaeon]